MRCGACSGTGNDGTYAGRCPSCANGAARAQAEDNPGQQTLPTMAKRKPKKVAPAQQTLPGMD